MAMEESRLYQNISTLTPWDKNPKIIRDKNFLNLKQTLLEEGQDLPLVIDTRAGNEGVIISGNMRYKALKELVDEGKWDAEKIWVSLKQTKNDAHFFKLAVQHNMSYGEYVPEQVTELANLYKDELRLDELDIFLTQPVDLNFHIENFGTTDSEPDVDTTDDKLDTYLNNQIKQIVLYFEAKQYEDVLARLEKIADELGLENNTEVFLELLNSYEHPKESN